MHRIHPKDLMEIPPEELSSIEELERKSEKVTEFTWKVAVNYVERRMTGLLGRSKLYFLDGRPITDESFLEGMTVELCQEYGLQLLDLIADLVLPVGFEYPSLIQSLHDIVQDAFKPISKLSQRKSIIWIDDDHWNESGNSILEPFMCQLLLKNVEPFLFAPKYFDREVLSMLTGVMKSNHRSDAESTTDERIKKGWADFATLLKFGFLLLLRGSKCPLIVIQISPKMAEETNAFTLLDLAESEGHKVLFLKNLASTPETRDEMVRDFVSKLLESPQIISESPSKQFASEENMENVDGPLPVNECCRMDTGEENVLENMLLDEYSVSESD